MDGRPYSEQSTLTAPPLALPGIPQQRKPVREYNERTILVSRHATAATRRATPRARAARTTAAAGAPPRSGASVGALPAKSAPRCNSRSSSGLSPVCAYLDPCCASECFFFFLRAAAPRPPPLFPSRTLSE